ncbi:MAG: HD domain-containing protein [Butyricicoccus sp.]
MIYTEQTRHAMRLAYQAHHGQVDKSGVPYIFHPIHVAEQMNDENSTTAALLHDVVEDTEWTLEDLKREGFAPEVLEAVRLLTHDPAEPYLDYVRRLGGNPIARAVKLADLRHNSDPTRMPCADDSAAKRREKYRKAMVLLEEQCE